MATGVSGSFDITSSGFSFRIVYEETYDVASNQSTVTITNIRMKSSSYYGYTYYLNGTVKLTANGSTKTVITMNSQTPTHKVTISKSGTWYSIYGKFGSVSNLTHDENGNLSISIAISIKCVTTGGGGNGSTVSGSKSIALTKIARKSTLNASDGTLGTSQTLTISSYNSDFTHSLRYECGDQSGTVYDDNGNDVTKISGTSISYTPPLNLAKQSTSNESVTITFTLYTFENGNNDATEIGTTIKTITCAIPESVKPSCSLAITDVLGHKAKYGSYVQGQSKLEIVVTPELAYESPIDTYSVSVGEKTYSYSDIEVSPITESGTVRVSATVKDKRKRTGYDYEDIVVVPYSSPIINTLTAQRCNADGQKNQMGDHIKVVYSYTITPLSNINSKEIVLSYKKQADNDFINVPLPNDEYSVAEAVYIFEAAIDSSYEVSIVATDDFVPPPGRSINVSTAACYMDWDYENDSIAFGKVSEKSKSLECAWDIYDKFDTMIRNGLSAYGGASSPIDPNTTIESLILTNSENCPEPNVFYYIHTVFYNSKADTENRAQTAMPYKTDANIYHRYCVSGVWSEWKKMVNAADILDMVFPVNSIYISYSHTSPAELFGGTWHRMESRFLWGTTSTGTIGATGGEQTHKLTVNEMPSHNHTAVSVRITQKDGGAAAMRNYNLSNMATDVGIPVVSNTGGDAAHNNMPPYVNVALWRRTA